MILTDWNSELRVYDFLLDPTGARVPWAGIPSEAHHTNPPTRHVSPLLFVLHCGVVHTTVVAAFSQQRAHCTVVAEVGHRHRFASTIQSA